MAVPLRVLSREPPGRLDQLHVHVLAMHQRDPEQRRTDLSDEAISDFLCGLFGNAVDVGDLPKERAVALRVPREQEPISADRDDVVHHRADRLPSPPLSNEGRGH
jgi:hypothetical protein